MIFASWLASSTQPPWVQLASMTFWCKSRYYIWFIGKNVFGSRPPSPLHLHGSGVLANITFLCRSSFHAIPGEKNFWELELPHPSHGVEGQQTWHFWVHLDSSFNTMWKIFGKFTCSPFHGWWVRKDDFSVQTWKTETVKHNNSKYKCNILQFNTCTK